MVVRSDDCIQRRESMKNGKHEKANPSKKSKLLPTILIISVSMLVMSAAAVVLILNSTRSSIFLGEDEHRRETSVSQMSYEEPMEESLAMELSEINIQLTIDNNTEKLSGSNILSLVDIQKNGEVWEYTVNEEKVHEYTDSLKKKYDTFVPSYSFTSSMGEEVTLKNSSVGWLFDSDYAAAMITEFINEKKSVRLDLTDKSDESQRWWTRLASDYEATRKKGTSYAEVSIDHQYMWLYKDGKVVLESPVVTGNPYTGNATPKGAFVIQEKASPTNLYGAGWTQPVDYWMAFNNDIGFHDATWQSEFGGTHYLVNGSHGCVNLPLDIAEKLYKYSYVYMPVYVY